MAAGSFSTVTHRLGSFPSKLLPHTAIGTRLAALHASAWFAYALSTTMPSGCQMSIHFAKSGFLPK